MARAPWVLDQGKFLSTREVRTLLNKTRIRAETCAGQEGRVAARDYFLINLLLNTGLRVGEAAELCCGDVLAQKDTCSLTVRRGKGGRSRSVAFSQEMGRHVQRYLHRKEGAGEPVAGDSPLFFSPLTRKHLTTRALQKAFKRCAARAGLSPHYSIHSLRHTYACHLYKASGWNLRLVQKQLGHSHIGTTQVYADVMEPDLRLALTRLYR